MRLISQVEKLEAAGRAAREASGAAAGIAYTHQCTLVDAEELQYGDYIACDVRIEGGPAVWAGIPDALSEPPAYWFLTERVTRDPEDLGFVTNSAGARVGRVVDLEGSALTLEADAVPAGGLGFGRASR